ncbi:DUF1659 domain-containing protein [Terrilactibacillus sp. BCM23-1]|uniref:DUF1659 domain-containing protein n=1 Tax=Terrilactibacillus tamarindi TaxID=2599694 RepID=A0A6N8CQC9_9BACI|nr:DUF1659 domain-containing protein [Terrilactibacillus tamarindi]MTT32344.1 DUF1659 domain-containing protein [Terrilactibacillus tamarindi]
MATADVLNSTLILLLDGGLDEKGKQIYKRKSFRNIKPSASQDALYAIAQALAPLQTLPLIDIERTDVSQLHE